MGARAHVVRTKPSRSFPSPSARHGHGALGRGSDRMTLQPTISAVTDRVIERSRSSRTRYLDLIARERDSGVARPNLSCGTLAHGFAASGEDQPVIRDGNELERTPGRE